MKYRNLGWVAFFCIIILFFGFFRIYSSILRSSGIVVQCLIGIVFAVLVFAVAFGIMLGIPLLWDTLIIKKRTEEINQHLQKGEFEKALSIAWSTYRNVSKWLDEYDVETIEIIRLVADIYRSIGQLDASEHLLLFALARIKRFCDDNGEDYEHIISDWKYKVSISHILQDLSSLYVAKGDEETASKLLEQARQITENDGHLTGHAGSPISSTTTLQLRVSKPPRTQPKAEPVDCVIYSKPIVKTGEHFLVQVFVLQPSQLILSTELARKFDNETEQRSIKCLEINVYRNSKLAFHIQLPGLAIDDPIQNLVWQGKPRAVQFGVFVPPDFIPQTIIGTVTVSRNGIPIGHLKFKLDVSNIARKAFPLEREPVGHLVQFYTKAFISYATKDRSEVLKRVQMLPRLGIDFFQDLLDLEPGEHWENELYKQINSCDLFLLFWSNAAKNSQWVMKEVEYALARKGGDENALPEIIPIIIEVPPPMPPEVLANLHFNDYFLYLIAGQEQLDKVKK